MSFRALTLAVVVLAVLGWLASLGLYTVGQAEEVLLVRLGKPVDTIRDPGLNFKIPFVDAVIVYDKRLLPLEPPVDQIILGDQKRIVVETFARFRITEPLRFYQSVGTVEQARTNLAQVISSILRKQLGKVSLSALLTDERDRITARIRDEAAAQAVPLGIDVVDVRMRRADLPPETSPAIYERMSSERVREANDLRAQGFQWGQEIRAKADRERTVLLSEAQRDSQMTRGEGDAEANRILAAAYGQDPDFFDLYRTLEVYRGGLTVGGSTLLLSPSSDLMKYFENGPFPAKSALSSSTSSAAAPNPAASSEPSETMP
jgi:modulator of FtsH protease HflC